MVATPPEQKMATPNRPLTPDELFSLVESNARAIEALGNQAVEDREEFSMDIAELKMQIAETNRTVDRLGERIEQQGQNIDRYFAGQAEQNRMFAEIIGVHEARILSLEN
jgi:septal ring factor EnvC (AmiA/AmiB activator)